MRCGIESSRLWLGGSYRSGEVAQAAIDALRGDPAGRDPVMKRLEPL